jgi:osmotically-inducible protein OsmY
LNLSHAYAGEIKESDTTIEQRVSRELGKDPFIKHYEIKVTVINGTVTLTDSVENILEQAAATGNAFQGGAKEVHNLLRIKNFG